MHPRCATPSPREKIRGFTRAVGQPRNRERKETIHPMRVCNIPGCPNPTDSSRCREHQQQARRARLGNDVYASPAHRAFRAAVLQRDPVCVECRNQQSTVADHYPLTRRELVARRLDPNNPAAGRGLCATCHNRHTAATSPGGWNRRTGPGPYTYPRGGV